MGLGVLFSGRQEDKPGLGLEFLGNTVLVVMGAGLGYDRDGDLRGAKLLFTTAYLTPKPLSF